MFFGVSHGEQSQGENECALHDDGNLRKINKMLVIPEHEIFRTKNPPAKNNTSQI